MLQTSENQVAGVSGAQTLTWSSLEAPQGYLISVTKPSLPLRTWQGFWNIHAGNPGQRPVGVVRGVRTGK